MEYWQYRQFDVAFSVTDSRYPVFPDAKNAYKRGQSGVIVMYR